MANRKELQAPLLPVVSHPTLTQSLEAPSSFLRTTSSGRRQHRDSPRVANRTSSSQIGGLRQKDKLVPLSDSADALPRLDTSEPPSLRLTHTLSDIEAAPLDALPPEVLEQLTAAHFAHDFTQLPVPEDVYMFCVADVFEGVVLRQVFAKQLPEYSLRMYQDVLHASCPVDGNQASSGRTNHVFLFEYGVLVFWGLPKEEQQRLLSALRSSSDIDFLSDGEVETDRFQVVYAAREKAHIQNDVITLSVQLWSSTQVKLAISHALAQSTKLAVYEERVMEVIERSRHLPEQLASQGRVKISRTELAQLIGCVYLQRAQVNLLSSVLDTPEFFWDAPDSLDVLYKRMLEYLELEDRVEAINNRFMVLSEMLDLLRDQQANLHGTRLELIVIWLIVISVVIGLLEVVGLFGFKKSVPHGPAGKL